MSTKSVLVNGIFWSAVEKYSSTIVALIVSAILARLISPAEFGIVSLATVMIAFFSIFTNMGIAPAIIQRNDLTEKNLDSIFSYTIIFGLGLCALFFSCSWLIARFYDNSQLIPICQLLSINLLLLSINLVPNALMLKNKRFKLIAQRTFSVQIVGGSLAIWAALSGWGVYSLLIAPMLTALFVLGFNIYNYPRRIDWKLDLEPLCRIFSYSVYSFLFELVNYFSRNLDKLIIGRVLNISALGYYDKSYRLMLMPLQQVTSVINPVLQPVLSSLQTDMQELSKKYEKIIVFLGNISFPMTVFLFASAYELINIVYGSKWNPAIPTFRILALSLPFQMILSSSGAIFQASNYTNLLFLTGIRNTFFTVTSLLIAVFAFQTIEAVAWSWNISLLINFVLTYRTMYKSIFHVPLFRMMAKLKFPLLSALILSAILLMQQLLLPIESIYFSLLSKCTLTVITMLLIIYSIYRKTPFMLLHTIKS